MRTADFRCVAYDLVGRSTIVVVGAREDIERLARAEILEHRFTQYGDLTGKRKGTPIDLLVVEQFSHGRWRAVAAFEPPFRPQDPLHWS